MPLKTIDFGVIDFERMDSLQKFIVGEYLWKNAKQGKIKKKPPHTLNRFGIVYTFNFPENVDAILAYKRSSDSKTNPYHFAVMPSNQASFGSPGGFGNISNTTKVGALRENKSVFFKNYHITHIIKELCYKKNNTRSAINKEANITQKTPHAHAKQAIFTSEAGYIIMHQFKGQDLLKWLNHNRKTLRKNEIDVARELLYALQEQVHERGILHGDIKPENIIVDINPLTGQIEVNFADFGFSQLGYEEQEGGTRAFVAPETKFFKELTEKSDVFSLGLVIAILCNLTTYQHPKDDFIPNYSHSLYALIQEMIHNDMDDRISLTSAIDKIEKIRINEKCKNLSSEDKQLIQVSNAAAIAARKEFKEFALTLERYPSKNPQKNLESILDFYLDKIGEQPEVIEEFIASVGIKFFKGKNLQTKQAIKKEFKELQKNFLQSQEKLFSLCERLPLLEKYYIHKSKHGTDIHNSLCKTLAKEAKQLKNEISAILDKNKKFPASIDGMIELTERFEKKLTEIAANFEVNNGIVRFSKNFSDSIVDREALKTCLLNRIQEYKDSRWMLSSIRRAEINDIQDFIKRASTAEELKELIRKRVEYIKDGDLSKKIQLKGCLEDAINLYESYREKQKQSSASSLPSAERSSLR